MKMRLFFRVALRLLVYGGVFAAVATSTCYVIVLFHVYEKQIIQLIEVAIIVTFAFGWIHSTYWIDEFVFRDNKFDKRFKPRRNGIQKILNRSAERPTASDQVPHEPGNPQRGGSPGEGDSQDPV